MKYIESYVYSAGDVNLFGGNVVCSGESETLKIKSQPGDAEVITLYNYDHGVI